MTELDIHIRKLLAVLDIEMDAARQELDERRATETGIIGGLAKCDIGMHRHALGVPVSATPPTVTVKGVKVI